ncbi:MAG: plasmid pRiA4b ORF-3 family protein [Candidatus Methanoperedenaceae archaeon]|nr:plasmid pRiA4b ORF-3 family protein [Candidatus Methanoperedenaceae archaeon]
MKKKFDQVYQFKITLQSTKPPIWRRIQIPETYTFWDLHVAIQDVMGWSDYHLHEFEIMNPSTGLEVNIGLPDDEFGRKVLVGWNQKMADYFSIENPRADYVYDFGDYWEHRIQLEKILPREKNVDYPICIKGKRACPPEDVGGIGGYEDFLEIIKNPDHEEHDEMLEWAGGEFDPEQFDCEEVSFNDPGKRLKMALE